MPHNSYIKILMMNDGIFLLLFFFFHYADASTRDQPSWRKTAMNNNNTLSNNNNTATDSSQDDRRSRFRRMRSRNLTEEADNHSSPVLPVAQSTSTVLNSIINTFTYLVFVFHWYVGLI